MNTGNLSLSQAPPYWSVVIYFLTAPFFSFLFSLLMLSKGSIVFVTFYNYPLIAFVHLITIGFLSMVMIGAIMQMMPVIGGAVISRPVFFSSIIYILLFLGVLSILIYFLTLQNVFALFAILFLYSSLTFFSVVSLYKVLPLFFSNDSMRSFALSLLSLMILVLLGVIMLYKRVSGFSFNMLPGLLNLHIAWAFSGWIFLLVVGVSIQVIPMFYVTPEYPNIIKKWLPALVFMLLILYSSGHFVPKNFYGAWSQTLIFMFSFFFGSFSLFTLIQLNRRKRKLPDYSLWFWRTSMISLFVFSITLIVYPFQGNSSSKWTIGLPLLFIAGFAYTLVNGMLYKIVPFLTWFHLSNRGIFNIPTMKGVVTDGQIKIQFYFHLSFLVLIAFAILSAHRIAFYLAFIFLLISSLILFVNLFSGAMVYHKIVKRGTNIAG